MDGAGVAGRTDEIAKPAQLRLRVKVALESEIREPSEPPRHQMLRRHRSGGFEIRENARQPPGGSVDPDVHQGNSGLPGGGGQMDAGAGDDSVVAASRPPAQHELGRRIDRAIPARFIGILLAACVNLHVALVPPVEFQGDRNPRPLVIFDLLHGRLGFSGTTGGILSCPAAFASKRPIPQQELVAQNHDSLSHYAVDELPFQPVVSKSRSPLG